MLSIFIITLWLTLIITRIVAHYTYPDKKNYKTSRAVTAYLRNKTGYDIHHIHLGYLIFLIASICYFLSKETSIIFFGISVSLIADQIFFYPFRKKYSYWIGGLFISFLAHVIITFFAIIVNSS